MYRNKNTTITVIRYVYILMKGYLSMVYCAMKLIIVPIRNSVIVMK